MSAPVRRERGDAVFFGAHSWHDTQSLRNARQLILPCSRTLDVWSPLAQFLQVDGGASLMSRVVRLDVSCKRICFVHVGWLSEVPPALATRHNQVPGAVYKHSLGMVRREAGERRVVPDSAHRGNTVADRRVDGRFETFAASTCQDEAEIDALPDTDVDAAMVRVASRTNILLCVATEDQVNMLSEFRGTWL